MPNWCHNRLQITGDPFDVAVFTQAVSMGPDQQPDRLELLSFEVHRPTPPELLKRRHEPGSGLPEWMVWRREHWGTKWDVEGARRDLCPDGAGVTYSFVTAWNPPMAWLVYVARLLPDLGFEIQYVEPLLDFAGYVTLAGGWPVEQGALAPDSVTWLV